MFKARKLRYAAETALVHRPRGMVVVRPIEVLQHELEVHQIELEMQNEALRSAQFALEESRDRYVDLYEFAPVGYLTLSSSATIAAINLTGAMLLGQDRRKLLHRHFSRFVAPEDSDGWHHFFLGILRSQGNYSCDLSLRRGDGSLIHVHLDCRAQAVAEGVEPEIRATLTDIGERVDDGVANLVNSPLFDSPHQFICLLTLDGLLIKANSTALNFAGLTATAVAGMPLWDTPWWSACRHSQESLRDAIPTVALGSPMQFRSEWRDLDGQTAVVDVALRPVRDAKGEVARLILEGRNVTKQCRAESALRTQEVLMDDFFQAAPVGMVLLDKNLRYVRINGTLAAMNGLPASAHIGKTLNEAIPALAPEIEALYEEVLARSEPVNGYLISCPSSHTAAGLTLHRSISLFPIPDAKGEPAFLGGIGVDVTAQVQADAALRATKAELREAQRLAGVGSWEWLPQEDRLVWSPELYHITGLAVERPAPRKTEQAALYSPEGWAQLRGGFKSLLAGGATYEIDLRVLRPDGACRWVIARAEAVRDDAGSLIKVRGTVQDITARKAAEHTTQKLAAEVQDLYENAPCGYHSLDIDGCFVRINNTELRWLGYEREVLLGQKFADLLSLAGQRQFARTFTQLKRGGSISDVELDLKCQDGRSLPVLLNASAVYDEQGCFVMSRATVTDMTATKRELQARLKHEQRRAEIAYHLITVQEEERRRLALDMHDVVSPNLAAVQINLGIIESGLPHAVSQYLGARLKDVQKLIRDTHCSLRDICSNLRPSVLDYAGLYATVEEYVETFGARTGIEVTLTGGACGKRLPAEVETLLYRIVQEALTNCAKYAQARLITIELSHDEAHAHLEITDDGIGFDLASLGENGRKPGLGLLTMGERAELAGGQLRLQSQPGHGTRITLEI